MNDPTGSETRRFLFQRMTEKVVNAYFRAIGYRPACLLCGKPLENPARNDGICPGCDREFYALETPE
jgi:hypothetical protein